MQGDFRGAPDDGPAVEDHRASFDFIVAEISYVVRMLRRLGVHERDLEDSAQDVLVTAYRRLPDYDTARPVRPWLAGITCNIASDYRRLVRHGRELLGDAASEKADETPSAEDLAVSEQERALVIEALGEIEIEQRIVLVMHDLEGHAMPEIVAALSIPLNTAYSRLRLAREKLKTAVRRRRQGER